jgi:hypothetical protein
MNPFYPGILACLCILPNAMLAQQVSPQAARADELFAIIESSDVASGLTDEPINTIESLPNKAYRIISESCTVTVKIVDTLTPTPRPGPRQFKVIVTRATCR